MAQSLMYLAIPRASVLACVIAKLSTSNLAARTPLPQENLAEMLKMKKMIRNNSPTEKAKKKKGLLQMIAESSKNFSIGHGAKVNC